MYSTFQAAEILGVSADTVLKWIKSGKIPATRTLGGHFRIQKDTLVELTSQEEPSTLPAKTALPQKTFQYCWEFSAQDDTLKDECRRCLVYKSRAKLCYELSSVPKELGLLKLLCDSNCEECDYRKYARDHSLGILVVTDDSEFLADFDDGASTLSFKTTKCEYECSSIVEKMRPDLAIIDCSFHKAKDFCDYLSNDSRIPHVKIILVSDTERSFDFNSEKICSRVSKPLNLKHIEDVTEGIGV